MRQDSRRYVLADRPSRRNRDLCSCRMGGARTTSRRTRAQDLRLCAPRDGSTGRTRTRSGALRRLVELALRQGRHGHVCRPPVFFCDS